MLPGGSVAAVGGNMNTAFTGKLPQAKKETCKSRLPSGSRGHIAKERDEPFGHGGMGEDCIA